MESQIATLVSTVFVDSYGTGWSSAIRLLCMSIVSGAIIKFISWSFVILGWILTCIGKLGPKSFIVSESSNKRTFYYFNKWIMTAQTKHVSHAISTMFNGTKFTVPTSFTNFDTNFKNHVIHIKSKGKGAPEDRKNSRLSMDNSYSSTTDYDIEVCSKTAHFTLLEEFVKHCVESQETASSTVTNRRLYIHTLVTNHDDDDNGKKKSKNTGVEWVTTACTTNKCLSNTILSKKVEKELVKEVKDFVNNEQWYCEKGIPYKKNFFLHGPGGTGKTSIIKAIAAEYGAEVFCISMSEIKTDAMIQEAGAMIRNRAHSKYVILCLEDLDRSEMFDGYYSPNENRKLMQGLLQVLDGINEPYAQLTFITANDPSKIEKASDVLTRPGRIDKKIEITYCDEDQMLRMAKHHYGLTEDADGPLVERLQKGLSFKNDITPASLIQLFCTFPTIPELLETLETSSSETINNIMKVDNPDVQAQINKNLKEMQRKKRLRWALNRTKSQVKRLQKSISEEQTQKVLKKIEALNKRLNGQQDRLTKLLEKEKQAKLKAKKLRKVKGKGEVEPPSNEVLCYESD